MRNHPSWLVIFVVAPFNKIPLFSENLITFIMPFMSLFVSVISEPSLIGNFILSLSNPLSTKYLVRSPVNSEVFLY